MDFRDFLNLAIILVNGGTEADWRSAVSRAYYAAFHVARQLLDELSFVVPRADRAHGYLWLRLANAGPIDVEEAGNRLTRISHRGMKQGCLWERKGFIDTTLLLPARQLYDYRL